ncbi:hypothetical protein BOTBODRAFT_232230 [Botryobasidium botryosum FD-172 SS1]|uniref:Uncharacterized protein n=1 Tax=Botryobasidium botryosum (strain FD-172 SS1) TaxID=930990 RepID=A0A067M5S8_BOTB1|nr:hypothetical protein BOTBODRAFT_232230 [Botryobasidium botryosum FD-172 SS1]
MPPSSSHRSIVSRQPVHSFPPRCPMPAPQLHLGSISATCMVSSARLPRTRARVVSPLSSRLVPSSLISVYLAFLSSSSAISCFCSLSVSLHPLSHRTSFLFSFSFCSTMPLALLPFHDVEHYFVQQRCIIS